MNKILVVFVMIFAFVFVGCASRIAQMKLTTDQQVALDKAMAFPLDFEIDKTDGTDAWGRAQSFISKYSPMKLQTVTDYVLETYNSVDYAFSYNVTKAPLKDKYQITVQCHVPSDSWQWHKDDANRNAHILAYYIATGQLLIPELVEINL